jgi:hypothetical protein
MAFGAKQIFPNDTRARVAIGVDLPLNGEVAFRSNYQTKDAIKNNLINYFLTNPGDNLDFLKEDIQDKLATYFPRVVVEEVEVTANHDQNQILVTIKYFVANTDINDTVELSFV